MHVHYVHACTYSLATHVYMGRYSGMCIGIYLYIHTIENTLSYAGYVPYITFYIPGVAIIPASFKLELLVIPVFGTRHE